MAYWIGKNNWYGRLRYWWAKRWGTVHGDIYFKPTVYYMSRKILDELMRLK